jgi:MscS family membrane protein
MVLLWGVGALWLGLPTIVFRIYVEAIVVVAVIAFTVMAYRLTDVAGAIFARRAAASDSRFDDLLVPLLRKTLKVLIVAIGLVTIAGTVGIEVAGLLAGLGLGGLAFALAAQDTVSNLFGSITVLLDRPFQVGDWVVVGDVEGTVEEMGFRSTRIRTFYNSLITLPNSNLIKASVDNLGARRFRRWSTRLGVAYNTPPEKIDAFCEGIRELVERHPYTRKDYYHVYFNGFAAACLEILLYVFFETPDWATELRERHRLAVDILRLAHELEVEFAFPTQTIYLRDEPWTPPELAGSGYPQASRAQSDDARRAARELVDGALGGQVPPPVTFAAPPVQDGGDAGE